jgi:predicted outer membrane repeat protein
VAGSGGFGRISGLGAGRSRRLLLAALLASSASTLTTLLTTAHVASASTIDVTNCNDSGSGSLRQALLDANSGDVIDFVLSCSPIALTSGVLEISKDVTIGGPGANTLAVSAGGTSGVFLVDAGFTVSISGLTIEGSSGSAVSNSGNLTLGSDTLSGNANPSGNGGALANAFGGSITVTDSTFSGNSASGGGAIYNNGGPLEISDSTFAGNSATLAGGALNNAGSAALAATTFSGNSAEANGGGAIATSGTLSIGTSIVAASTGGDCSGTITTDNGYNIADDGTCGLSTSSNDLPSTNPLLDPNGLQSNGGTTETIALDTGSPAIARVPAADCQTTDQRAINRVDPCDVGAYETNSVIVQTLNFTSTAPNNAAVGGPTYTVTATGGTSGNPVVFTIDASATSVCSVSGSTVSFIGAGTCVIDANQAGNARYTTPSQIQQSFTVYAFSQTITFTSTPPNDPAVGAPPYHVTATGGGSGNPVVFTIDSSANGVCTINSATVSFIGAGICVIDANQAGNASYAPGSAQQSFGVGQLPQVITFTSKAPTNAGVGSYYHVAAIGGGSGNPIVFTSGSITVCTVKVSTVHAIATGTCLVDANQTGNRNYASATQAVQQFVVHLTSQSIVFTSSPPVLPTVGGKYKLTAKGGASGNRIVFSSATPSVCQVSGRMVKIVSAGTCTVNANQSGNTAFSPAAQVEQTFFIGLRSQTITFTSKPPTVAKVKGKTYKVSAFGGSSGNPVTFSIDRAASSVCTVVGSTVSFIGAGTCTIDANQAGNASFLAAPQVEQLINVDEAPVITSSCSPAPNTVGQSYSCTITAAGSPAPLLTVRHLPHWLFFSDNGDGSASVSGTPTSAGTFTFTVTAQNAAGKARATLTVTITN